MLKYLTVLLDDTSVSFCHYSERNRINPITLDYLRKAVRFAMLENLNVQFVWPAHQLPEEYKDVIASIDHTNIAPLSLTEDADITVLSMTEFHQCPDNANVVARIALQELIEGADILTSLFSKANRVNIVIMNPEDFHDDDIEAYRSALTKLSETIYNEWASGHNIQVNLLTDRMLLTEMNNCNAGHESITLAPDGKFYACPAFYYSNDKCLGSIDEELDIKNQQLFSLDYSPICRKCDAWHCRRCVWLNKKYTFEVNTPGHEQCVMSHIERQVARELSLRIKNLREFTPGEEIKELDYLDPFDILQK
ncbi:MAG: CXXX repeat peptide maturase [Muribaculaceae bacterium]|nr:CXXX repeat peptide maturase [Muribaculaceae bacterium]